MSNENEIQKQRPLTRIEVLIQEMQNQIEGMVDKNRTLEKVNKELTESCRTLAKQVEAYKMANSAGGNQLEAQIKGLQREGDLVGGMGAGAAFAQQAEVIRQYPQQKFHLMITTINGVGLSTNILSFDSRAHAEAVRNYLNQQPRDNTYSIHVVPLYAG